MRVIAGYLGGRSIAPPKGHRTHPMGDKIRGALFNMLGDIEGLTVLDAFAGSGAVSVEAISRGAKHVTAVDVSKQAVSAIADNIKTLELEDAIKPIRANASSWSDNNQDAQFDIVILDPPYNEVNPRLLQKLSSHVRTGGIIVLSLPPTVDVSLPERFDRLSDKSYGDATLVFYRRIS